VIDFVAEVTFALPSSTAFSIAIFGDGIMERRRHENSSSFLLLQET
jgi:hypothetical protein